MPASNSSPDHVAVAVFAVSLSAALVACNPNMESRDCPVVGNVETRIYHVPGDRNYGQMLQENTRKRDNRICFKSHAEAEQAGYRRSKSGSKKWWDVF